MVPCPSGFGAVKSQPLQNLQPIELDSFLEYRQADAAPVKVLRQQLNQLQITFRHRRDQSVRELPLAIISRDVVGLGRKRIHLTVSQDATDQVQ
jgi:hypothetical protein